MPSPATKAAPCCIVLRALKVSYSDVGERGAAVNCENEILTQENMDNYLYDGVFKFSNKWCFQINVD